MNYFELKEAIAKKIAEYKDEAFELNVDLFENPEISGEEYE